jgi:hypothetical protein
MHQFPERLLHHLGFLHCQNHHQKYLSLKSHFHHLLMAIEMGEEHKLQLRHDLENHQILQFLKMQYLQLAL